MRFAFFFKSKTGAKLKFFALVIIFVSIVADFSSAQVKVENKNAVILPRVIQIDEIKLKEILKPKDKPLLVNFWATWCEPCREEFPDLVKIDADYKGKIDLITISLDELSEINRDVPKFLSEMKAEMPTFLLKTADEDKAISTVSKDWAGGLPFTILLDETGKTAYFKQGKFKTSVLRGEIDKVLSSKRTQRNLPTN